MIFHVTIEQSEDGWSVVECPALPGCVAITAWLWGEDQKAALKMKDNDHEPIVVAL